MGFFSLFDKILYKFKTTYYKHLFAEKTGQDVSTTVFQGKLDIKNPNITIGKNVHFRGDIIFDGDGPIVIGDDAQINHGTIIFASKNAGVSIGSKTAIAAFSYIIDMDHGIASGDNFYNQPNVFKKITIGNNVWIAQNCTILKGSTIGDNVVCAAKSVITGKAIPENAIVAGVPAKIIKFKE